MGKRQSASPKKRVCAPKFLAAFRNSGNVRASCEAAGIDRETYRRWKRDDAEFAAALEDAIDDATDILEAEARMRARKGSDTLLIFLLKAHRPEKYRDRYTVDLIQRFDRMTDYELDEFLARRLIEAEPGGEDSAGDAAVAAGRSPGEE